MRKLFTKLFVLFLFSLTALFNTALTIHAQQPSYVLPLSDNVSEQAIFYAHIPDGQGGFYATGQYDFPDGIVRVESFVDHYAPDGRLLQRLVYSDSLGVRTVGRGLWLLPNGDVTVLLNSVRGSSFEGNYTHFVHIHLSPILDLQTVETRPLPYPGTFTALAPVPDGSGDFIVSVSESSVFGSSSYTARFEGNNFTTQWLDRGRMLPSRGNTHYVGGPLASSSLNYLDNEVYVYDGYGYLSSLSLSDGALRQTYSLPYAAREAAVHVDSLGIAVVAYNRDNNVLDFFDFDGTALVSAGTVAYPAQTLISTKVSRIQGGVVAYFLGFRGLTRVALDPSSRIVTSTELNDVPDISTSLSTQQSVRLSTTDAIQFSSADVISVVRFTDEQEGSEAKIFATNNGTSFFEVASTGLRSYEATNVYQRIWPEADGSVSLLFRVDTAGVRYTGISRIANISAGGTVNFDVPAPELPRSPQQSIGFEPLPNGGFAIATLRGIGSVATYTLWHYSPRGVLIDSISIGSYQFGTHRVTDRLSLNSNGELQLLAFSNPADSLISINLDFSQVRVESLSAMSDTLSTVDSYLLGDAGEKYFLGAYSRNTALDQIVCLAPDNSLRYSFSIDRGSSFQDATTVSQLPGSRNVLITDQVGRVRVIDYATQEQLVKRLPGTFPTLSRYYHNDATQQDLLLMTHVEEDFSSNTVRYTIDRVVNDSVATARVTTALPLTFSRIHETYMTEDAVYVLGREPAEIGARPILVKIAINATSAFEEPSLEDLRFIVAPNPAVNNVVVMAQDQLQKTNALSALLLNPEGKLVKRFTYTLGDPLDISTLTPGMYTLVLRGVGVTTAVRILKAK